MPGIRHTTLLLGLAAAVSASQPTTAATSDETLLLRQPDVRGDRVAFVYAGDIWTASTAGGAATRLTSHEGFEVFPVFSPDGRWIAFSAEYSGNRQIWVVPAEGGEPRRLTWYPDVGPMPPRGGWDNIPVDWTADGKQLLIRSNRTPYDERTSRYYLVDVATGGLPRPLQIPEGGPASLSPDGSKLAYSIMSREFRTWKRYRAGRAQDVWLYDLTANTIDRLTDFPGTDTFPMWVGDTVYFQSDRASVDSKEPRTLNLFAFDLATRAVRQVTKFSDFDCMWPRRGGDQIVFENGGALWLLDTTSDTTRRLSIQVRDDRPHALPAYTAVKDTVDSFDLSPSGARALFAARGDLFTVPAKHGQTRDLSATPAVRERDAGWSPDGKWISYLSEAPGDYELFVRPYRATGSDAAPTQLTKNTEGWITGHRWSPDSRHILLTDTTSRLWMVAVPTGTITEVDRSEVAKLRLGTWSADGQWLAYTKESHNRSSSVWLYSLASGQRTQVTDDVHDDMAPSFDPGGRYLYFLSNRDFDFDRQISRARPYLITLQAATTSPFVAPDDDEPVAAKADSKDAAEGEKKETKKDDDSVEKKTAEPKPVTIDLAGIADRIVAFPLEAGPYADLLGVEGGVLTLRDGTLRRWDLDKREEKTILSGVEGYVVSADGKKLLYTSDDTWAIVDLAPDQKPGDGALDLAGLELRLDPATEWRQIFTDAWRIMRDWFYDPNMHGVDWQAMYDKYRPLADHLGHRADLDYLLGELIGELNAGHTYVHDAPTMAHVKRVDIGVLGCDLEEADGRIRIARIFAGRPWDPATASPLRAPGVSVTAGEYLLAIDGHPLAAGDNPYRWLENRVGVEVALTVGPRPELAGSREVVVTPVASERQLLHFAWVEHNRQVVDELSGGRVGYIYVPDTAVDGHTEFYRGWAAQFAKDALIVDDRYNGGGFTPERMAFHIARPVLSYWAERHLELAAQPVTAHTGPKVMLVNGRSSSGGDAFPSYFRTLGLGPLMGSTTWGGLIGYSWSPEFVDGGGLAVPAHAFVNTAGAWDVEAVGVKPDIEVFDDPTLVQAGREPVLERAVAHLLAELEKNPPQRVTTPPGPDRS